jgi:hypothetical protein
MSACLCLENLSPKAGQGSQGVGICFSEVPTGTAGSALDKLVDIPKVRAESVNFRLVKCFAVRSRKDTLEGKPVSEKARTTCLLLAQAPRTQDSRACLDAKAGKAPFKDPEGETHIMKGRILAKEVNPKLSCT